MNSETLLVIARVRRAMPRNADVQLICDELEGFLTKKVAGGETAPKFDRNSYQREYMRQRRAAAREKK